MRTTLRRLLRNRGYFAAATTVAALIGACGNTEAGGSGDAPGAGPGDPSGPGSFENGEVPSYSAVDTCSAQGKPKTTLTGKVYDPAGANPLYNVMVYVPGGTSPEVLPPLKDSTKDPTGVACETCASVIVNPVTSGLTDGTGTFKLEGVPAGKNVPLVIQVGKWRRLLHLDVTAECGDNSVSDKLLRLPKNGEEGDLPQIAVTSGYADAMECFLRGVGIDEKEFVQGHGGTGHVHLFKGYGGGMGAPAEPFWNDAAQLKKYDMVLLSCEGGEHNEIKGGGGLLGGGPPDARRSMGDYLNAGGKVFATHYHYTWFKNTPHADLKNLADWQVTSNSAGVTSFDITQSFPKGARFAEWVGALGISTAPGKLPLEGVTNSLTTSKPPTTTWIQGQGGRAKYFSFNTPLAEPPEKQCGRAVFSDVHSASEAGAQKSNSPTSLDKCEVTSGSLNNKQKALEFLFFDLSACVSDERVEPKAPR